MKFVMEIELWMCINFRANLRFYVLRLNFDSITALNDASYTNKNLIYLIVSRLQCPVTVFLFEVVISYRFSNEEWYLKVKKRKVTQIRLYRYSKISCGQSFYCNAVSSAMPIGSKKKIKRSLKINHQISSDDNATHGRVELFSSYTLALLS